MGGGEWWICRFHVMMDLLCKRHSFTWAVLSTHDELVTWLPSSPEDVTTNVRPFMFYVFTFEVTSMF